MLHPQVSLRPGISAGSALFSHCMALPLKGALPALLVLECKPSCCPCCSMLDESAITKAHQGYLYPAMGDPVGEEVRLLHDTKDIYSTLF